jgi:putative ABC transport system substrate-binding protein
MKRRQFITLASGAAAAWPLAARAQRINRMQRIGVLLGWSENDLLIRSNFAAAVQRLAELGWVESRNVVIDVHWTSGNLDQARAFANELVASQPDVIFTGTTPATAAVKNATSTIPIIFVVVADPVGAGFVNSLSQPGGNITGFINIEAGMGGKWAGLLKEIAPDLSRLAIMFNPETAPYSARFLPSFDAAAQSLGVETISLPVRSKDEIETSIASLGPRTGLVVMTDSFLAVHRAIVISLVAKNRIPAIFESYLYCKDGGLISYGPDYPDLFRRAAMYIDRVLRGTKPNELPVEVPIKFELAINTSTARALGLALPDTLLTVADELVE